MTNESNLRPSIRGSQIRSGFFRSNLTIVFCEVSPYVFLTPISSMLFYQSIQPKKIDTSADSEKKASF